MRRRKWGGVIPVAGAFLGLVTSAAPAHATTIDFDSIAATCCYIDVIPGGPRGPLLAFPAITFDDGVVMSDDGWSGGATTEPNLYGTSDFLPLDDGSLLPGVITGILTGTTSALTLDIINGASASTFTLSAFDAGDVLIDTEIVALSLFGSPGFVGSASVSGSGIKKITVTSAQGEDSIDFAIDTVVFDGEEPVIPEPGSMLLFGLGGLGAGFIRRRRLV